MKKTDKTRPEESPPFLVLTSGRAAGFGGVILALLVAMFFIGTLVGRGDVRVDLDRNPLALEIDGLTKSHSDPDPNDMARSLETQSEFQFYEALKTEPDKTRTPPAHDPTPKVKKKTVVKKKQTSVKPVPAIVRQPSRPAPSAPKPAAVPQSKPSTIYKYTIQAASLRTQEDADQMTATLKRKGYSAYTVKALVRDKEIWYRVRIGAFKDRIEAKPTLSKLKKDNIEAFLVSRQENS